MQLVHYRCLGLCINLAARGCPMSKKEIFHCPPTGVAGFGLTGQSIDYSSESESDEQHSSAATASRVYWHHLADHSDSDGKGELS